MARGHDTAGSTLARWARRLQRRYVAVSLVALLLGDAICIATRYQHTPDPLWGGDSSTMGTWLCGLVGVQFSRACMAPSFPKGIFLETADGVRFLGPLTPEVMLSPEAFNAQIVTFAFVRSCHGFWAPTVEYTQGRLETDGKVSPETKEKIRRAARGHLAEMEYRPRYAKDCERIVQSGDFSESHLLVGGVLHNIASLALAGLTAISLGLCRWPAGTERSAPRRRLAVAEQGL